MRLAPPLFASSPGPCSPPRPASVYFFCERAISASLARRRRQSKQVKRVHSVAIISTFNYFSPPT